MKIVYIKTIGTVRKTIAENLAKSLQSVLPFRFRVIADSGYPLFAFEPKRNQYYAKKIIEKLACDIPLDCEKLICLTDVDLCTPVLTFVYGEAQLGGSIALVSLNRLRQEFYYLPPNDTILIERVTKECIHELGHCYGLYHCSNPQCVMCFSSSVLSIDNKLKKFCVGCGQYFKKTVRKENHASK